MMSFRICFLSFQVPVSGVMRILQPPLQSITEIVLYI